MASITVTSTYTVQAIGDSTEPGDYTMINGLALCNEGTFDIESPDDFEAELESLPSEFRGQYALVQTDSDGWTGIIKKATK